MTERIKARNAGPSVASYEYCAIRCTVQRYPGTSQYGSPKCLDQFDPEISRLWAALAPLMGQQEQLCDEIAAHKAPVSPARRMPRDIIQEIFIACLPTGRNPVMASAEAHTFLDHICNAWRHISLSTPRLWSSLHIVIPANAESTKQLSELVKIWLGRSGGLPLSITVVLLHTFNESMSATDIFATLKTFSRRWENIQFPLALATKSLLELLSQIPMEYLPMLKNIPLFLGQRPSHGAASYTNFRDPQSPQRFYQPLWLFLRPPSPVVFLGEIAFKYRESLWAQSRIFNGRRTSNPARRNMFRPKFRHRYFAVLSKSAPPLARNRVQYRRSSHTFPSIRSLGPQSSFQNRSRSSFLSPLHSHRMHFSKLSFCLNFEASDL